MNKYERNYREAEEGRDPGGKEAGETQEGGEAVEAGQAGEAGGQDRQERHLQVPWLSASE